MPGQSRNNQIQLSLISDRDIDYSAIDSMRTAFDLCMTTAGYSLNKQISADVGMSISQFSKWREKLDQNWLYLRKFMKKCHSDIPLLWLVHQMAYEVSSLRKQESEMEKLLRLKDEELARERLKHQATMAALRDAMSLQAK